MISLYDYSHPAARASISSLFFGPPDPLPPDTNTGTPTWTLLVTVFASILEVFILCLAGWILARNGILDKRTQKQLNRLNVSLFTPSLLFSKVAFALSPQKLKELWIIPIFFVIVTAVSGLLAWLLGYMFRLKRTQRNFAMAASMFNNSNSLPIALMQSLVVTVKGLKWNKGDTKDAMLGRALTYLVLYSTLGMMLRWSFGVHLLSQSDDEVVPDEDSDSDNSPLLRGQPALTFTDEANTVYAEPESETPASGSATATAYGSSSQVIVGPAPNSRPLPVPRRNSTKVFYSFPNTPTRSIQFSRDQSTASTVRGDDSGESDDDEWGGARRSPITPPTSSRFRSILRRMKTKIFRACKAIGDFMTVPLWAALASLIVACVKPLQHALDAHMQPVKGSLTAAGNCSIPVTLIVLGAYFYTPQDDVKTTPELTLPAPSNGGMPTTSGLSNRWSASTVSANLRESLKTALNMSSSTHSRRRRSYDSREGETKTVLVAVVTRMILTPLALLPFVAGLAFFDLHKVMDDPVFVVCVVLLISSPPALTLAQITQAASGDAFERLISRTIFVSYCILTPPLTILYVVIGLSFSKL